MAQGAVHHGPHHEVSIWPFPIGIGTLLIPIAFTMFFHYGWQMPGLVVGAVGLVLILIGAAGWANEHFQVDRDEGYGWLGILSFILSELVIFGTIFAYFWTARVAHADQWSQWIPEGISLATAGFLTLILWASSFTIFKAEVALEEEGNTGKALTWVFITFVLGTVFVILHMREWMHLWHEGFTLSAHAYGTGFYALTGLHTSHVIVGLITQLYVMWLLITGKMTKEKPTLMRATSAYWHFVDVMWMLVAGTAYLVGTAAL
ncbi:MAG: heme-copper oxidase subunit III [Aquificae bacterium]|nr:heme-copper oxidase subunit III [Aquificota bacterium]